MSGRAKDVGPVTNDLLPLASTCPAVSAGMGFLNLGMPADAVVVMTEQIRSITDEYVEMEKMSPEEFFNHMAYVDSQKALAAKQSNLREALSHLDLA